MTNRKYTLQRIHRKVLASQHLVVQIQQWKHQDNKGNLFKVDNKGTLKTSIWCLYC